MDTKQFTYQEWLKFYNLKPEMITCEECGGKGEYNDLRFCDCEHCSGHYDECEVCCGKGEVDKLKREYRDLLNKDLYKMKQLGIV